MNTDFVIPPTVKVKFQDGSVCSFQPGLYTLSIPPMYHVTKFVIHGRSIQSYPFCSDFTKKINEEAIESDNVEELRQRGFSTNHIRQNPNVSLNNELVFK